MNKSKIIQQEAKEFQDTILRSVEQHPYPYPVRIKGQEFVIFPETFNPNYAKASLLLLDNLGVKPGDKVLDPFAGCGVDAIFAVLEGASSALAIEEYTLPYLCASYNAHQIVGYDQDIWGYSGVWVKQGNLFEPLHPYDRFSLVIANPPFKQMEPETALEAAIRDDDYMTLRKFFSEVGNYLTPGGRIRIVFSNVGDLEYFETLAEQSGFKHEIVDQTKYASSVLINVYEMRKT